MKYLFALVPALAFAAALAACGSDEDASYRGGYAWATASIPCIDPLTPGCPSWTVTPESIVADCQFYMDQRMARVDGFTEDDQFLQGCKDAVGL